MNREKLQEATINALQGKLTELKDNTDTIIEDIINSELGEDLQTAKERTTSYNSWLDEVYSWQNQDLYKGISIDYNVNLDQAKEICKKLYNKL